MAAVDTYEALTLTYDSFRSPAYAILVDGRDMEKELGVRVQNLSVKLDMIQSETASFDIWAFYDLTARALNGKVKNGMKPGKRLEVRLGYGSALTTVFKGYIDQLSLQMSEETSFSWHVEAADVKKLLKEGGKRMRVFETNSYTKVFKMIMSEYQGLCSVVTGAEAAAKETFTVKQESGDMDFITQRLVDQGLGDWTLCITGGEASLMPSGAAPPPVLALGPGRGLKSFHWSWGYLHKKIVVRGYSYRSENGTNQVEQEIKEPFMESLGSPAVEFVSAHKSGKEELKRILEGRIKSHREGLRSGTLSCTGLPQLKPGKRLILENIDEGLNDTYLIRNVSHSIGDGGFTTDVSIG